MITGKRHVTRVPKPDIRIPGPAVVRPEPLVELRHEAKVAETPATPAPAQKDTPVPAIKDAPASPENPPQLGKLPAPQDLDEAVQRAINDRAKTVTYDLNAMGLGVAKKVE